MPHNKKGFTLIEVLLVVAIIGILTTTLLVGFGGTRGKARDAKRTSDLRQVQTGLELYFTKCGYYPGVAQGGACGAFQAINSWAQLDASLRGSGLGVNQVPNDPTSGQNYFYGSAAGTTYVLGARFEDATNPALSTDLDGSVQGVACDDPVYCIQL